MSVKLNALSFVLIVAAVQARVLYDGSTEEDNSIGERIYDRSGRSHSDANEFDPPPHTEYAKVARYIVHKSDWTSMGTLSTLKRIEGFPMVNIISVADSPRGGRSTGHIYFLLTDLDFTGQDLHSSNRLTALFSDDQDLACTKKKVDPMEPTCGRIMISGIRTVIDPNDRETYRLANESFVSRHPASTNWVHTHDFYLCELKIQQIAVLNYYGGPHYVNPEDYYDANYDSNDAEITNSYQSPVEKRINPRQQRVIPSVIEVQPSLK